MGYRSRHHFNKTQSSVTSERFLCHTCVCFTSRDCYSSIPELNNYTHCTVLFSWTRANSMSCTGVMTLLELSVYFCAALSVRILQKRYTNCNWHRITTGLQSKTNFHLRCHHDAYIFLCLSLSFLLSQTHFQLFFL